MVGAMEIGTLIKALGGPSVVAADLGMRLSAVGNWTMRNAIPREHHLAVWRLATTKKVPWTPPDATGLVLVPAAVETPSPANDAPKSKSKRATRSTDAAAAAPTSSAKAA
jgi:hypothetical protein